MTIKICAIRDAATESWGLPIFVNHIALAIRSFQEEINNPESQLSKYPHDFELFSIGEYDNETGTITNNRAERIARGLDYKKE